MLDLIADLKKTPWKPTALEPGYVSIGQLGFDGSQGPEMVRARFPGRAIPPHYHRGAQFQLLLSGSLEFQDYTMVAPAIHYTDHNVVYGPFRTMGDHEMIVVHALPAGTQGMIEVRKSAALQAEISTDGREFQCSAESVAWQDVPGVPGARRKVLLDSSANGPGTEIVELPEGAALPIAAAPYGRYEFVFKGSATVDGRDMPEESIRFVKGEEAAPALVAGPNGATVIVLVYDKDAERSYGGTFSDPAPIYLYGKKLKTAALPDVSRYLSQAAE